MAKAFALQIKLGNIVGRSKYITDPKRQEKSIFHSKKYLENSHENYAKFGKKSGK